MDLSYDRKRHSCTLLSANSCEESLRIFGVIRPCFVFLVFHQHLLHQIPLPPGWSTLFTRMMLSIIILSPRLELFLIYVSLSRHSYVPGACTSMVVRISLVRFVFRWHAQQTGRKGNECVRRFPAGRRIEGRRFNSRRRCAGTVVWGDPRSAGYNECRLQCINSRPWPE